MRGLLLQLTADYELPLAVAPTRSTPVQATVQGPLGALLGLMDPASNPYAMTRRMTFPLQVERRPCGALHLRWEQKNLQLALGAPALIAFFTPRYHALIERPLLSVERTESLLAQGPRLLPTPQIGCELLLGYGQLYTASARCGCAAMSTWLRPPVGEARPLDALLAEATDDACTLAYVVVAYTPSA